MTKDELEQMKVSLSLIAKNINQMVSNINDLGDKMNAIDNEEQPEEFKEAAIIYSQAKTKFTSYLMTVVDGLGITIIDLIEDIESSPKAKLWVPN